MRYKIEYSILQEMVDGESKNNSLKQLQSVQSDLEHGRNVSQTDVKEAAKYVNKLRVEYPYRFEVTPFAVALGGQNYWKSEEDRISFEPDRELADELRAIQKVALAELRAKQDGVRASDCVGQPREPFWIQSDIQDIELHFHKVDNFWVS